MVSPLFYLMAAAMVLMALASYRYNKILFLVEGTAAVLSGLAVLVSDVLYRRNISTTVRSAKRVLTGEEEAAFQAFALPVAVVAPAGDIVWANEAFAGSLCGGRNFLGDNVLKYIYPKTFRQVMDERGTSVSHNGREYTVYGARAKEGYILYFVDDTYFKTISKEYRERRPVVCLAAFDNREELVRDSFGGDDSRIVGEVDAVMRRWVIEEMNGFVRRLDSSRYLFVVDDAHIEQAKQKRFHVLDEVRTIKSARNNMSATMSIGVGRGAKDIAESERWARQALDMALGRGGDQVAVKQEGDSYEFFGGLRHGPQEFRLGQRGFRCGHVGGHPQGPGEAGAHRAQPQPDSGRAPGGDDRPGLSQRPAVHQPPGGAAKRHRALPAHCGGHPLGELCGEPGAFGAGAPGGRHRPPPDDGDPHQKRPDILPRALRQLRLGNGDRAGPVHQGLRH